MSEIVSRLFDQSGLPSGTYPPTLVLSVRMPDEVICVPDDQIIKLVFGRQVGAPRSISSITEAGDYIVEVPYKNVRHIPHDFALASLCRTPEGFPIDGMTPDIVTTDESGELSVLELSTTQSMSLQSQRIDVLRKVSKYSHLVSRGLVKSVAAMSVSRNHIVTNLSNASDFNPVAHHIINSFCNGLKVMQNVISQIGASTPDEKEISDIMDLLSGDWPILAADGRESQCFIDDDYDALIDNTDVLHTYAEVEINHRSQRTKRPSFDWFNHKSKNERIDKGAVASIPFFVYSETPIGVSPLMIDEGHNNTAGLTIGHGSPMPKDLRKHRETKPDVKMIVDDLNVQYRTFNYKERLDLAKRGVMAKELRNEPDLIAHREDHHRPLSRDCDVSDIESYLLESICYGDPTYNLPVRLDECYTPDMTGYHPRPIVDAMLKTELLRCLGIFQRIMSEVVLEMKLNPRDKGDRRMFIVKKIEDGLFVVIRPTRYAGKTDSHTFYQVVSYRPLKTWAGVFEQFHQTNFGAYATRFMSITRDRAAQYIAVVPQIISLWGLLIDECDSGLCSVDDIEGQLFRTYPAIKALSLVLLEAKEYTSRNLQQFRFYYMDLVSTKGPSDGNWKFMNKLDPNIRSRLFLYFMVSLRRIHHSGSIQVDLPEDSADPEDFDELLIMSHETKELNLSIPTPFFFTAHTMQQLLIAMYACVLHNKDESEATLAGKQIVAKLVKQELSMKSCLHPKGDPSPVINTKSYGDHDWSLRAVKFSAQLLKKRLEEKSGDLHVVSASTLNETTMLELCTTKSSHSGNTTGPIVHTDEIPERTKRSKCFIEYMRLSSILTSHKLVGNLKTLSHLQSKTNHEVHVKMFKKNQIGGTREILILDFVSRCLIRGLEDISRSLASICELDMLTKPKLKHLVVRKHMNLIKEKENVYTKRYSLDKTTWCQRFVNPLFYTLLSTLMPRFKPFFRFILNSHTKKKIELPETLIRSFMTSRFPDYSDYAEVAALWKEFHGLDEPYLLGKGGTNIRNISNMMQGILHYTSTLHHCSYMTYLEYELRLLREKIIGSSGKSFSLDMSSQVSSDDSGMIITVSGELLTPDIANSFFCSVEDLMFTTEKAFCMRTSIEKSTITSMPLYEFNSTFHSGNNLACPLIKFVARSCDDNVADSLKSRVESMYSSLREVRSNGASGALTTLVGFAQHMSLCDSFGCQTQWYFNDYSNPIYDSKLSTFGFYRVFPPIMSGLFSSDLSDYLSCVESPRSSHMSKKLRSDPTLQVEEDVVDKLVYRMWPTRRYNRCLDSLGIDRPTTLQSDFDDIKVILESPVDSQGTKTKLSLSLINHSISRSFAILSRTDNQFSQAYILWDRIFKIGDEKMALDEYYDLLMSGYSDDVSCDYRDLFPLHMDYDYLLRYLRMPVVFELTKKRYVTRSQGHACMHTDMPNTVDLKRMLLTDWYGENYSVSRVVRKQVKTMFPWYSHDRNASLRDSGLTRPLQLVNFMLSHTMDLWGFNLLAAGSNRDYKDVIIGLMSLNTFRLRKLTGLHGVTSHEDPPPTIAGSDLIRALENRMSDWCFLATTCPGSHLDKLSNLMSFDVLSNVRDHLSELKNDSFNQKDDFMRFSLMSVSDKRNLFSALSLIPRRQIIYRKLQKKGSGGWYGEGLFYIHTRNGSARVRVLDNYVVGLDVTSDSVDTLTTFEELHLTVREGVIRNLVSIYDMMPKPVKLGFYRGFGKAQLMLMCQNNLPILKLDNKPRMTNTRLTSHVGIESIRFWLQGEEDPHKWERAFSRDKVSMLFFRSIIAGICEKTRVIDTRYETQQPRIILPVEPEMDLVFTLDQMQGDFLDNLISISNTMQSTEPDNGTFDQAEEADELIGMFSTDTGNDAYWQSDISRLFYHPFVRFFTLGDKRVLPPILNMIRVYLKFLLGLMISEYDWLTVVTDPNFKATIELMEDETFSYHVSLNCDSFIESEEEDNGDGWDLNPDVEWDDDEE